MRARPIVDLTLIASSIFLAFVLLLTSGDPTSNELLARKDNVFPVFSPEDIKEIHLHSPENTVDVRLRHAPTLDDPQRYLIGKQGQNEADGEAIAKLLDTLDFAAWERIVKDPSQSSPSTLGFNSPRLEVRVDAGPRSYRLLFGGPAPSPPHSIYAQVEGRSIDKKAGVVDEKLLKNLLREEQEFRAGLLIPYSRSRTSSLKISSAAQQLELSADELGFLLLPEEDTGAGIRADRILVDLIFYQLARAKIDHFLKGVDVESLIRSDSAMLTIVASSPDGPDYNVQLGGDCPHDANAVVALRTSPDPVAGCVTRTVLAALRSTRPSLVDHSAFPLNDDETDHVVVHTADRTLDLLREGAEFRLSSRKNSPVSLEAGNEFLQVLSGAKLKVLSTAPQGLSPAIGTILVKGQSPATVMTKSKTPDSTERTHELSCELYAHPSSPRGRIIKRVDDGAWLEVPKSLVWAFSTDDAWARDRSLSKWQASEIDSVSITTKDGQRHTVVRSKSVFLLAGQDAQRADGPLVRQLLDELSHLNALRFTRSFPRQKKESRLQVDFTWKKAEGTTAQQETLWIGRRTRGGYLSWATFAEGVFVLPLSTPPVFNRPLVDRSPLDLDPTRLEEVELITPNAHYSFSRVGDELSATGDNSLDEMVAPLQEALANLKVISATQKSSQTRSVRTWHRLLTLKGKRQSESDVLEPFVIHIVSDVRTPETGIFQAWLEGDSNNYLIDKTSVIALLQLL